MTVSFEVAGIRRGQQPEPTKDAELAPRHHPIGRAKRFLAEAWTTSGAGFLGAAIAVSASAWIAHVLAGFGWTASLAGSLILAPSVASLLIASSIPETLESGFARLVGVTPTRAAGIPTSRFFVGLFAVCIPALGTTITYLTVGGGDQGSSFLLLSFSSIVITVGLAGLVGVSVRRPLTAAGVWAAFLALWAAAIHVYIFSPPSAEIWLRLLHLTPILLPAEALGLVPSPWGSPLRAPVLFVAAGTMLAGYVGVSFWEPEEPRPMTLLAAWLIQAGVLAAPLLSMTLELS